MNRPRSIKKGIAKTLMVLGRKPERILQAILYDYDTTVRHDISDAILIDRDTIIEKVHNAIDRMTVHMPEPMKFRTALSQLGFDTEYQSILDEIALVLDFELKQAETDIKNKISK